MRHLYWEDDALILLDQRRLPTEEVYITCRKTADVTHAIATLAVRGAPAIGVAAAYACVLAFAESATSGKSIPQQSVFNAATEALRAARPTAVNLAWAVDLQREMYATLLAQNSSYDAAYQALLLQAQKVDSNDLAQNKEIAKHGAALFDRPVTILTHCNAGALATAGIGTALGVIRELHLQKKLITVYMDETRPLLQGARLTAYELTKDNIPCTLICDNMAASTILNKKIDAVIVGADRITTHGDVANKIGTYGLAVLAYYHNIPFYVAAPSSTFDFTLKDGSQIPIEERAAEEVRQFQGVCSAPQNVAVWNPAFDVTPAELVTGIITEKGVLTAPYKQAITKLKEKVKQ